MVFEQLEILPNRVAKKPRGNIPRRGPTARTSQEIGDSMPQIRLVRFPPSRAFALEPREFGRMSKAILDQVRGIVPIRNGRDRMIAQEISVVIEAEAFFHDWNRSAFKRLV